jgi:hypothetical protein
MIRATLHEIARAFLALAQAAAVGVALATFGAGFPLLMFLAIGRF